MDFKKLKNYAILAILIIGGMLTLYNEFFSSDSGEQVSVESAYEEDENLSDISTSDDQGLTDSDHDTDVESSSEEESNISTLDDYSDSNIEDSQSGSSQSDLQETSEVEGISNEDVSDETIDTYGTDDDPRYIEALTMIEDYPDIRYVSWSFELEDYVIESYTKYAEDGWNGLVEGQSEGTKAGGRWGNYDDQLPEFDTYGNEINYKEFDVNDKIQGQTRDAERFVVGDDGSVYYTWDHYDTYIKVIE